MKATGKTLVLSGLLPSKLFGSAVFRDPVTILEYANVLDISRAWKVKSFRCWLKSTVAEMNFLHDCKLAFRYQLNTDDIPNSPDWFNAGDNRAIAWGTTAYDCIGEGIKNLAYSGAGTQLLNEEIFLQPDHIVQNKLVIGYQGVGPQLVVEAAANQYQLNYIIELEEWDITPTESIFHNIKSKAQDLSN